MPTAGTKHGLVCCRALLPTAAEEQRLLAEMTASCSAEGTSATCVGPACLRLCTPAPPGPSSSLLPAVLREGLQGALTAYSQGMGMHCWFYRPFKKHLLCLSVPVRLLLEVRLLLCTCAQFEFYQMQAEETWRKPAISCSPSDLLQPTVFLLVLHHYFKYETEVWNHQLLTVSKLMGEQESC